MGMDRSSELTALDSGSMVRTTNGNCLLVSSLLPSVEIVNGPERMRSAKFFCVKRARSCRMAVVLFPLNCISIKSSYAEVYDLILTINTNTKGI